MFNIGDIVFINNLNIEYPENQYIIKFLGSVGKIVDMEIIKYNTPTQHYVYVVEFKYGENIDFVDEEIIKIG